MDRRTQAVIYYATRKSDRPPLWARDQSPRPALPRTGATSNPSWRQRRRIAIGRHLNPRHTKKGTTETANPWTQVVANWSDELAERLGRSKETLLGTGLRPADFPADRTVEIRFADGSHAKFHRA